MVDTHRSFRFPPFAFDPHSGELSLEGRRVKLHPQPAQVLRLLIRRAGEVITREEIQKEVWGDETFVDFELGINSCIRQIRTALRDDAEHPRYVQTLPRRGYRFVAAVESVSRKTAVGREPSPYPGLATFSEKDAPFFFGREEEIESVWS